jgi:predicted Zn-dependent protease
VLVTRGQADAAVHLIEGFLAATPEYEGAYVTLAKIHLAVGRTPEGIGALERLLQRNPGHPVALELLREWRPR